MDALKDLIASTAKTTEANKSLVQGKKWVKRGDIKKATEKEQEAQREQERAEAERAKRRRQQDAIEQMKKRTRQELDATEAKLKTGRSPGSDDGESGGGATPRSDATKKSGNGSSSGGGGGASGSSSSSSSSSGPSGDATKGAVDAASDANAADGESQLILPVFEVIRRLRSLGAPITLFGESDVERLRRMRKVEVEGIDDEGIVHAGSEAMRNVFLKGKANREVSTWCPSLFASVSWPCVRFACRSRPTD
jgi:hypothetical protein